MENLNTKTLTDEQTHSNGNAVHSPPVTLRINGKDDRESEIQKMLIEEKMKEFEEKIRKQYELQKKLEAMQNGSAHMNGSLNGNAVQIDLSKVKTNGKVIENTIV